MYERNYNFAIRYFLKFSLVLIGFILLSFIQNPSAFATNPTIVGSVNIPWAEGVYVSGSRAYVADNNGLMVYDISNPPQPSFVERYTFTQGVSIKDVHVSGSLVYLAADLHGLLVMDISNPDMPTIIGSVDTPHRATGVYVSGPYAYVTAIGGGLYIIDITNPGNPTIVGQAHTNNFSYDVYAYGSYAYVAGSSSGLQIVDISNPWNPVIAGSITKIGTSDPYSANILMPTGIYVSGTTAFTADMSGLQVINISDWNKPSLIGSISIPFGVSSVYVSGPYAYVTSSEPTTGGLYVVDISMFTVNDAGDPSVTISLNKTQFKAGDNMTVTLTTTPGSVDNLWDVYVGLILPDSTLYFMTYEPSFSLGLYPVSARPLGQIISESVTILNITLPSGLPTGNWSWGAVLAKPDMSEISQISWAPFTISDQPPVTNVTGTWRGTWHSSVYYGESGTFTANIIQQGATLSGSIDVPYIGMFGANLKGTVNGNTITFGDIGDQITFTGTVSGNSSASGTYVYPSINDNGTWQGTKT